MNTSIKISNHILSHLLQRIGEALGEGNDLIIHQSISPSTGNRTVYTEIPGSKKRVLEMEGNDLLNQNEGTMSFDEEEIKLMEEFKECPETGVTVDKYTCKYLCQDRKNCNLV